MRKVPKGMRASFLLLFMLIMNVFCLSWTTPAHSNWTGPLGPVGGQINALAIDPANPQTIYAGTGDGVFMSTNGGQSWTAVNKSAYVYCLAINPTNPQIVYAGTIGGGVFMSTDGGQSWAAVNSGLTSPWISSIAIDPANPQTIYAGADGGVFMSTDGGQSWTKVNSGLTASTVNCLAIDPANPQIVYVGTSDGVYVNVQLPSADFKASPTSGKAPLADEAVQEIPLDKFKLQPIKEMERSVPSADFDFFEDPTRGCLCAVSVLFKPPQSSAAMWVSDRSWFTTPETLNKFDRMLSVLDGSGDVNNLGLNSCSSFFCWEGDPWISGVFKEIEAPLFPSADKTRAFILRPQGLESNFCVPSRLVILARKDGYFIMIQDEIDDSFTKECWKHPDGKNKLTKYFDKKGLREKAASRSKELAGLFEFRILSDHEK